MVDVMDLELGKVKASATSSRGTIEKIGQGISQKLEGLVLQDLYNTRTAEYCLFYSGFCDPDAVFIIKEMI